MKLHLVFLIMVLLLSGCSSSGSKKDTSGKNSDSETSMPADLQKALSSINSINKNSPSSISAFFNIDGFINNKKMKSGGNLEFSKNGEVVNAVFIDAIFKSAVGMFFRDSGIIKIYLPVDKKLIVEDPQRFDIKSYTGIDVDFNMLYLFATGRFPVIKNASVKHSSVKDNSRMIVLENDRQFQTISIKDSIPDKMLVVNKATRQKFEFYLSPVKFGESTVFKTVRIFNGEIGLNLTISFDNIRVNQTLKVKTISDIKLPPDVQIIKN